MLVLVLVNVFFEANNIKTSQFISTTTVFPVKASM